MAIDWRKRDYNSWRKAHRIERKKWARSYLGGKCVQCGSKDNLEFDHIDPKTKLFNICSSDLSKDKLRDELAKCQLLCKRCHLKKTYTDWHEPTHGTPSMYTNYKCRCDECKRAWRVYFRSYRGKKRIELAT